MSSQDLDIETPLYIRGGRHHRGLTGGEGDVGRKAHGAGRHEQVAHLGTHSSVGGFWESLGDRFEPSSRAPETSPLAISAIALRDG